MSNKISTSPPSVQNSSHFNQRTSKIFFSLVEDLIDMDAEMMEFSCYGGDVEKHKNQQRRWVLEETSCSEFAPQRESTDRLQGLHRVGEVAHEGESIQSLLQTRDPPKAQDELVLVCQLLHWAAVLLVVHQQLQLVVGRNEVRQQLQEVDGQGCLVVPGRGEGGGGWSQLALTRDGTVEADLPLGTYVSMAVQMLDGLIPALRKVIAKFLALLPSNRDVLLGAFLDGLFSLVRLVGFP